MFSCLILIVSLLNHQVCWLNPLFNGSNHIKSPFPTVVTFAPCPGASFQDLDIDQLLEPLTSMGTSKAGRGFAVGAVGLVGLEHEFTLW